MLGRRGAGSEFRVPCLLIAFNADPELYEHNNGYVVSEQGKALDFVLEVAPSRTRAEDNTNKRDFYALHGVVKYWRFDDEYQPNRVKLAGDQLVNGVYEPIAIEELEDGVLQGHSASLALYLRWEQGQLRLHDPATRQHVATFESETRPGRPRARIAHPGSGGPPWSTERLTRREANAQGSADVRNTRRLVLVPATYS